MRKRSLPYREGDCFALPLKGGGFAAGVVARADGVGGVVGYFFGPRREHPPTAEECRPLSVKEAVWVGLFEHSGLLDGHWPIVFRPDAWNREEWPLPAFARYYNQTTAFRVEYDNNTLDVLRETRHHPDEVKHLPRDGMYNHPGVELVVAKLLPE